MSNWPTRFALGVVTFSVGCGGIGTGKGGGTATTTSAISASATGTDFYYIGAPVAPWENTQNWSRTRGGPPAGAYPNAVGHNAFVVTPPPPKRLAFIREIITVARLSCNADDPTAAVRVHKGRLNVRNALNVGNEPPRNGKLQHGRIELSGDANHEGSIVVWDANGPRGPVAIGGRGNGELLMNGNCEFACQGNLEVGADAPPAGAHARGRVEQLKGLLHVRHGPPGMADGRSVFIGHQIGAHGNYQLKGGELKVVGNVYAGAAGAGELLISGGADLRVIRSSPQHDDGYLFIANSPESMGVVKISGDNVQVFVERGILVGGERGHGGGTGQLLLLPQANMPPTVHSSVVVWEKGTLKGEGDITDDVGNNGLIEPDHNFESSNVSDRIGSLHFQKQLKNEPNGRIVISVSPTGSCDQLTVDGQFWANGTIEIRYTGSPPPQGHTCDIVDAASIANHGIKFVFPPSENWDLSEFFMNGQITRQ